MTINWRVGNNNKRGDVLIVGAGLVLTEDVDGHPQISASSGETGGVVPLPSEPVALSEDVSFHASGSAGFHIWKTPLTIADVSPDGIHAFDATGYHEARLIGDLKIPGPPGCRIAVQHSADDGQTWGYLDGIGGPSFDTSLVSGVFRTSWVRVDTGAQQDVNLRLVLTNGDGVSPIRFGRVVSVQFRTMVETMNSLVALPPGITAPCTGTEIPPQDCGGATDNFDGYADNADLNATWTHHDTNIVDLDFTWGLDRNAGGTNGSAALKATANENWRLGSVYPSILFRSVTGLEPGAAYKISGDIKSDWNVGELQNEFGEYPNPGFLMSNVNTWQSAEYQITNATSASFTGWEHLEGAPYVLGLNGGGTLYFACFVDNGWFDAVGHLNAWFDNIKIIKVSDGSVVSCNSDDCANSTVNFDGYSDTAAAVNAGWTNAPDPTNGGSLVLNQTEGVNGSKALQMGIIPSADNFNYTSQQAISFEFEDLIVAATYTVEFDIKLSESFLGDPNVNAGLYHTSVTLGNQSGIELWFGGVPPGGPQDAREYVGEFVRVTETASNSPIAAVVPPSGTLSFTLGFSSLLGSAQGNHSVFIDNITLRAADNSIVQPCLSGSPTTAVGVSSAGVLTGSLQLPVSSGLQAWHLYTCGLGTGVQSVQEPDCGGATDNLDGYPSDSEWSAVWQVNTNPSSTNDPPLDVTWSLDPVNGTDGSKAIQAHANESFRFGSSWPSLIFRAIGGLTPGSAYKVAGDIKADWEIGAVQNSFSEYPVPFVAISTQNTWLASTSEPGFATVAAFTDWEDVESLPQICPLDGTMYFACAVSNGYFISVGHLNAWFDNIKIIKVSDASVVPCTDSGSGSGSAGAGGTLVGVAGSWADQSGNSNDLEPDACFEDITTPDTDGPGGVINPGDLHGTIPIKPIGTRMFGQYSLGNDGNPWPNVWDMTNRAAGDWIPDDLEAAKQNGKRIIISTGGYAKFRNSSGNYDPRLFDAWVRDRIAKFAPLLKQYHDDGVLYGINFADDVRNKVGSNGWPPNGLSNSEINRMAGVCKLLVGTWVRTIVRAMPSVLAQESTKMPNVDVSVAQYHSRFGNINNWVANEYVKRTQMQIPRILWSINTWHGGNGSSGISSQIDDKAKSGFCVSPSEYVNYGTVLAALDDSEGIHGWMYHPLMMAQPGMMDAFITVHNLMVDNE